MKLLPGILLILLASAVMASHDALLKAQDDLRALGGWSPTSAMPIYYGKRFIGNPPINNRS